MLFLLRWAVPAIVCILFYWRTLGIWFRADDFAWLGLRLSIHQAADLGRALFEPMAQGTVRFVSERAFFLTFEKVFGLEALPYRIAMLAALALACILLASITRTLTDSTSAGAVAAIFWAVQGGLAAAMGWMSSAVNQVFCGLLLLLAFWAFLERRTWLAWTAFLLGFGTLETTAVFPAILLAYALSFDRSRWKETLPFWVPSLAFAVFRLGFLAKLNTDPVYAMRLAPADLMFTLGEYLRLGAGFAVWGAIAALLLWRMWKRDAAAAFGAAWFLVLIAPVLPLRGHIETYYLAIPGIGLAFLLSVLAFRLRAAGWTGAIAALALISVFVVTQAEKSYWVLRWHKEHATAVRSLVRGIVTAHETHKDRTILLTGISNQLFWDAVFDNPWRLYGVRNVYLAPGAERQVDSHPEWGGINEWVIPPATVRELFGKDRAVVYAPKDGTLVNVTPEWRAIAAGLGSELSPFVDVGDSAFDRQLTGGWYQLEGRSRWMGKRASVELGVPPSARRLVLAAYCPPELLASGSAALRVKFGGAELGEQQIPKGGMPFQLTFPIPEGTSKKANVLIEVEASRTFRPAADPRELSVVFGTIQIQ